MKNPNFAFIPMATHEGRGIYTWSTGDRYDGDWLENIKHGKGLYYFANNEDIYVGEFNNDKRSGKGVLYYSNGDKYEGDWLNDYKNGKGIYYYYIIIVNIKVIGLMISVMDMV